MIYLDNAATTLQKPQAVCDAVLDAIHRGWFLRPMQRKL